MKSKIFLFFILPLFLYAKELPTDKVAFHTFSKKLEVNSQIIQLQSAKEDVMSLLYGHLERYFVKPSQHVKKGDKIALIDSPELSKMTASYLALKQQYTSQKNNYDSIKRLYKKGMVSQQELNQESIKTNTIKADLKTLESQLRSIGIDPTKVTKAISLYTLYAHASGIVAELVAPLHSSIDKERRIVTLLRTNGYYAKSFIPIEYAKNLRVGDEIVLDNYGDHIVAHITQILPRVDSATKRVVALASIEDAKGLFVGSFVASTIYFGKKERYLAVKKSALSFFNNEWVVFLPKEEEMQEHSKKEEEEEEETPYEVAVVKVITTDDAYVAIEGLKEGQEYISDEVYYAKSALLKGAIGDDD